MDAWMGYRRFVLGVEPDEGAPRRADIAALDRAVERWRRTGHWTGEQDD